MEQQQNSRDPDRRSDKQAMFLPKGSWAIVIALVAAVALLVGVLAYVTRERGTATDVANQDAQVAAKEGICQTAPSGGQTSMSNEACTFIANAINVLPTKRDKSVAVDANAPLPQLKPGDRVPVQVTATKPLPDNVTQRYPSLEGHTYFLDGQDIVVVDDQRTIAFVIHVRVRPDWDTVSKASPTSE